MTRPEPGSSSSTGRSFSGSRRPSSCSAPPSPRCSAISTGTSPTRGACSSSWTSRTTWVAAAPTTFLGLAYWGMGELEDGYRWYAEGMASLEKGGLCHGRRRGRDHRRGHPTRPGTARRCDADLRGRPGARDACPAAAPRRDRHAHRARRPSRISAGRLEEAKAQLEAGRSLGDELAFPRDPYRSRLVRARILQAEGDLDGAIPLWTRQSAST